MVIVADVSASLARIVSVVSRQKTKTSRHDPIHQILEPLRNLGSDLRPFLLSKCEHAAQLDLLCFARQNVFDNPKALQEQSRKNSFVSSDLRGNFAGGSAWSVQFWERVVDCGSRSATLATRRCSRAQTPGNRLAKLRHLRERFDA